MPLKFSIILQVNYKLQFNEDLCHLVQSDTINLTLLLCFKFNILRCRTVLYKGDICQGTRLNS